MTTHKRKPVKSTKTSSRHSKPVSPDDVKLPVIAQPRVWSLAKLLADDCNEYLQVLDYIRAGATPCGAFACIGISDSTWRLWWSRYKNGDRSPLIRKLGDDLARALGVATVVAEVGLSKDNPGGYLKGPARRLLSDDWNDKPTTIDAVPQATSTTNNVLILGGDVQRDALNALEAAGIITVRRTDTTIDALPSK